MHDISVGAEAATLPRSQEFEGNSSSGTSVMDEAELGDLSQTTWPPTAEAGEDVPIDDIDSSSHEPITVRELMTECPKSLSNDCTLEEAAVVMRDEGIGDILVFDGDEQLLGILTDRDIVIRCLAAGMDCRTARVTDAMSGTLVTVEPDDSAHQAVLLMREHEIRRLPVCEDREVVGIVSIGDLAVGLDRFSALADISAAPATT